jgi:hypothetical protein
VVVGGVCVCVGGGGGVERAIRCTRVATDEEQ